MVGSQEQSKQKLVPLKHLQLNSEIIISTLIFIYWLAYENVYFYYSSEIGGTWFQVLTNSIKLGIPFVLIVYSGVSKIVFINKFVKFYLIFFILFLAWIFISTALYGDVFEWLKLIPRLIFFIAIISLFYARLKLFIYVSIGIIFYVIYALLQYLLINANVVNLEKYEVPFGFIAGMDGLYANISSIMYFKDLDMPIVRLVGYWSEPSNAAGSCFAALYLALFLNSQGYGSIWKKISFLCLLAGILTLSNAGYLALAASISFGLVVSRGNLDPHWRVKKIIMFVFVISLAITAFFGRAYVYDNFSDNVFLRAVVGLRDLETSFDAGRVDLIIKTHAAAANEVLGVGLGNLSFDYDSQSASALFYWLLMGGYFGIGLLLLRDMMVALCFFNQGASSDSSNIYLLQALISVMVQHLSYGSWMNPSYFILTAGIFAFAAREVKFRRSSG